MRKFALIVEDEEIVRTFIRHILTAMNFEVLEAETEEEACQLFLNHQEIIQYIFSDVNLKEGNGESFYFYVRDHSESVLFVLASGYSNVNPDIVENDERAFFLSKPFSYDAIHSTITQVELLNSPILTNS